MSCRARGDWGMCPGSGAPERSRKVLEGSRLEDAAIEAAGDMLAAACDPVDDVRASADYRRRVIPRLLAKTIRRARAAIGDEP